MLHRVVVVLLILIDQNLGHERYLLHEAALCTTDVPQLLEVVLNGRGVDINLPVPLGELHALLHDLSTLLEHFLSFDQLCLLGVHLNIF